MRRALSLVVGLGLVGGGSMLFADPAFAATHVVPIRGGWTNSSAYNYTVPVAPDTTLIRIVRPAGVDVSGPGEFVLQGYSNLVEGKVPGGTGVVEIATTPQTWQQRPHECRGAGTSAGAECFTVVDRSTRWDSETTLQLAPDASIPTVTIDYTAGTPGSAYVSTSSGVEPPPGFKHPTRLSWGDTVVLVAPTAGYWTLGPAGTPGTKKIEAQVVAQWDDGDRMPRSRPVGYGGCAKAAPVKTSVSTDGKRLTVRLPKSRKWPAASADTEFIRVAWKQRTPTSTHEYYVNPIITVR